MGEELRRSPLFSEELGIDLASCRETEIFKWFLASLLYGARITAPIAARTYRSFERHGLLTPRAILRAGWDYLVNPVLREGGYVRYDESKSRQLLAVCQQLVDQYGGSLRRLHDRARDSADLERALQDFYGVGPVTANIFLRELRPFWPKANPEPLPAVQEAARAAGIGLDQLGRKSLSFARLEAGLLRQKLFSSRKAKRELARGQSCPGESAMSPTLK